MLSSIAKALFGLAAGIALSTSIGMAQEALPSAETQLKQATVADGSQARLQELFKKASDGGKITLGVIGGSITEGASCAKPDRRYHGVMLAWWKAKFPKSEFTLVNAGIGATGSNYGAMRAGRDLLSKSPDFVIMEYAVNDANGKEQAESYEGLIRQVLKAPSHPALMLLFMMKKDGTNAQEWQSKVGASYGLPMLSYRDALWPEIQAGRLKWEQISPDSVHPNESGHVFAGELICAFLDKALKAYSADTAKSDAKAMPEPLISDLFESCSLFDGEDLKPVANQGWTFNGKSKRSAGWESSAPGSVLEFEIEGEAIFISFWRIKGPMGKAAVSVDGGKPVTLDAWFEQTWGGYRHMQQIAKGLKPGMHKVKVELLQDRNPQSTGSEFRVLCLGSAGTSAK